MRVLLLGGGGREHAIGWKLVQSPRLERLVACPGNPGLDQLGDVVEGVDPTDPAAVALIAVERSIDLVIVGPEAPLAAGVADRLRKENIPVFGPNANGAMLETSKSFAKEVMASAGVPTAASVTFTDREAAILHLEETDGPYVVKADGLAGGKGVLVTRSLGEAIAWVDRCLEGRFGTAGRSIVVEEYLEGLEVSIIFVCAASGTTSGEAIPLEAARDYKRLLSGGLGPNTGGMGSFSPVTDLPPDLVDWTMTHVALPTLAELSRRSIDYTGFLYVGLMLTADGPKVLEFNCRLGDPEAQVLMPRLDSDLLEHLNAAATVGLSGQSFEWSDSVAVDVVLASQGYPDDIATGFDISGVDGVEDALVFHGGTAHDGERLVTSGGRVLNVVGVGATMELARTKAYHAAAMIEFQGKQFRDDIAAP